MPQNDFLVWDAGGTNIETQANYITETVRLNGVGSGIASSLIANKVMRQSSVMAALIADYIVQQTGQNTIDDGTTTTLLANLTQAIQIAANINTSLITTTPGAPLTSASAGIILVDATAGNIIITLPAVASENGKMLRFKIVRSDSTANTVTINYHSGDTGVYTGATSVAIPAATEVTFVGSGTTQWVSDQYLQARNFTSLISSYFPSSLGTFGWKEFPDPNSPTGFVIHQWGFTAINPNTTLAIILPIAFPTTYTGYNCSLGAVISSGTTYTAGIARSTLSQIIITLVTTAGSAQGVNWDVWGY